jgi:hypothetical protein
MAAGGFKEFTAGETLDEDDINDFLMQGVLVFAGTAARGSAITAPVEGQFAFLKDDDSLTFYDGSDWVELSTSPGAAVVSATTGSPTITSGTVIGGTAYDIYQFTGDGSITFSDAGFADILFVGGGAGGGRGSGGNEAGGGAGAGGYVEETVYVSAGTATVTVGAGGAGSTVENTLGAPGFASSADKWLAVGGGGGGNGLTLWRHTGGSCGGAGEAGSASGQIAVQGNVGGSGAAASSGGGGGAGAAGTDGVSGNGGDGGNGLASSITGTSVTRAGGGAGTGNALAGTPGTGGGGTVGGAGSANTGGGGGGGFAGIINGGNGGSGIAIVRVAV